MISWMSLDWFNVIQIIGIACALAFAMALEYSNRKLHAENRLRAKEDELDVLRDPATQQQLQWDHLNDWT